MREKTIGQLFEDYSKIINDFQIRNYSSLQHINRLFPMHIQYEESAYHYMGYSHRPLEIVHKDDTIEVLGISSEPFRYMIENFQSDFNAIKGIQENPYEPLILVELYYKEKKTNMYLDSYGYVYQFDKENEKGKKVFNSISDFPTILQHIYKDNLDLDDNKIKVIRYCDFKEFGDSDSKVVIGFKTKEGWVGGSHRSQHHFKIGDEIDLDDTVLVKSGYIKGHEKDKKDINYLLELAKNNKIKIENDDIAKFLCYRLARATG